MSLVPPTVEPSRVAVRPRSREGSAAAPWLVVCCYLLGAVVLTSRLWVDPAARAQTGDPHDVDAFAWFLRYAATAVAHGRLPALVTTALNAPQGVSLMWNTSMLLPGVLLAPVTLLAGPQVSLTILLTLGFAGSAASLFWVLRRWGASIAAAALGGAVYGFSPAVLNSGLGHYNLQFAVLPPLIIHALVRIVTGRGNAVRNGACLGLLTAAQVFIGEELLVDTALVGLVLVAVLVAGHARAALHRARAAAIGLATAAGVMLLICGHALWVQLYGPLSEHTTLVGSYSGPLAAFVTPPGQLLFHTPASAAIVADYYRGPGEYLGYLGWPLLAVLIFIAIRFWRAPKVRAMALTWAVVELCTLGGGTQVFHGIRIPGQVLPWHWLQGLPALAQVLPDRFSILADGAAAAALAFSLDLARSAPQVAGWRKRIPAAVAVLAILPLIPLPFQAAAVTPVPAGWQAAFARLRLAPDARVFVVPLPYIAHPQAMRWQAETGEPGSLIGGYFVGASPIRQASFSPGPTIPAGRYLYHLWDGRSRASGRSTAQVRADLAYWRPAAVVAVTSQASQVGRVLTGLLGRPTFQVGRVLAWRL